MSSSVPTDLPKMEYRFLGRSGLQVSAISIGGWLTFGGHVDNENTFACMKAAYDVGINYFDCAEGYSGGESEKVMGQAIKKFGWKRSDIVVSTKLYWGSANGDNPVNNNGLSRKRIVEGLNASLERLQLSYVDLVYAHRPDRNTPIEETVRAFNHVINQEKAFYWGTSEWNQDEIAAAWRYADKLGLIGPLMEQPQYNMLCRQRVESDYISLIKENGLGLAIFSPLKTGILTGKYNSGIPADSRLSQAEKDPFIKAQKERYGDDSWKKDLEVVKKLGPLAERLGVSQTNLAYAWVLKNPHVSTALTGASKPEQVYESVKALDAVKLLSDEIMAEIDQILQNRPVEVVRKTWY